MHINKIEITFHLNSALVDTKHIFINCNVEKLFLAVAENIDIDGFCQV